MALRRRPSVSDAVDRSTPLGLIDYSATAPAVEFKNVSIAFDENVVLRHLSFAIPRGDMRILLGRSGSGKSVLLKLILGLLRPDAGTVLVNGVEVGHLPERDLLEVRGDIGMVFQENALFDSLTVAENVGYRLSEQATMPVEAVRERVAAVLGFIGLAEYADRLPSELSGGQRRRVAIARAMAPEPRILLFDDPITGLDPLIATTIDNEIVKLRDLQQVTSILVTHQIRDAFYVATHRAVWHDGAVQVVSADAASLPHVEFMVLHEGRIYFQGSAAELLASPDPYIREYLLLTLPPW
ncbi:MAG: ATP-binding cassette domain-containing protein [Acidobacteriota bacterium]|nr:ATP-binding cassette domain-containing protein [Acidobacteriota bacterium]